MAMRQRFIVSPHRPFPDGGIDQALRFDCWTVDDARRLAQPSADLVAGLEAGFSGAPCPGPARSAPYRLGWEMGAIAARRVPVPAWMRAVNAQAEHDCIASA